MSTVLYSMQHHVQLMLYTYRVTRCPVVLVRIQLQVNVEKDMDTSTSQHVYLHLWRTFPQELGNVSKLE